MDHGAQSGGGVKLGHPARLRAPGFGAGRRFAAVLLAAAAGAAVSAAGSPRARSLAAYERALRMRAALEARLPSSRTSQDYAKLVRAFEAVYRIDPASPKAPAALAAAASLYEEMGRQFSDDRYYGRSIDRYQFLISQYPHSSLARDALFTIGEIYRADLENPDEARRTFERFLARYPQSSKAAEARQRLGELDRELARRDLQPASAPAAEAAPARPPRRPARGSGPPAVTDIRHWEGPNYTRIVIGVEGEVKFDAARLKRPDRIVFDLLGAHLSRSLAGKTFPVEDGFLRQIRVAQFKPTVARVVLDIQKIEDYSVFSLPNPFRLVIDVHGPPPPAAERLAGNGARSSRALAHRAPSAARPPEPAERSSPAALASAAASASGGGRMPAASAAEVGRQPPDAAPRSSSAGAAVATDHAPAAPALPIKPAAPTATGATTLTRALGLKIARLVIDPGHGGHDTGTIGPTGLREKDVVLDVALRLRKLIKKRMGSDVVMTRSDDSFIPLEERTAIANEKDADLFISIHANASRDPGARGIETYYLNFTTDPRSLEVAARENATSQESVHQLQTLIKKIALTEKIEESRELARHVQRSLCQATDQATGGAEEDRGLKKAPFVVLIGANMPSILAEISFLTNPADERLLRKPAYRERIAEALYQGIVGYANNLGTLRVAQKSPSAGSAPAVRPPAAPLSLPADPPER